MEEGGGVCKSGIADTVHWDAGSQRLRARVNNARDKRDDRELEQIGKDAGVGRESRVRTVAAWLHCD